MFLLLPISFCFRASSTVCYSILHPFLNSKTHTGFRSSPRSRTSSYPSLGFTRSTLLKDSPRSKSNGSCNFIEFVDCYLSCMPVSLQYGGLPLQDCLSKCIDMYLQVSWWSSYTRVPFKKHESIKYSTFMARDFPVVVYDFKRYGFLFLTGKFIIFASLWWVVTAQTRFPKGTSRWVQQELSPLFRELQTLTSSINVGLHTFHGLRASRWISSIYTSPLLGGFLHIPC